jgi:hypothetical protein
MRSSRYEYELAHANATQSVRPRPTLLNRKGDAASPRERILQLQRLAGNAAVTGLLTKRDGAEASGTIDLIEGEPLEKNQCEGPGDRPRLPVRAELSIEAGSLADDQPREKSDGVKEGLGVGSKVTHGGAVGAGAFGEERAAYQAKHTDFKGTKSAAGNVVEIQSTMFLDIHWNTHNLGRKDVDGPKSKAVTKKTYSDVVSDLTPDATGRPTRTKYWAADLTSKHERFHASDDIAQAKLYLPTLKAWMNAQAVTADKPSVAALVEQARGKIEADGWDHYNNGGEDRAYGDGKASYQDRVDKISARATKAGWP